MKIWPILQSFLAPVEQTAMETAVPIAETAVDTVLASNPALSPFAAIANALIEGAEKFAAANIHPNAAVAAVTHTVNARGS
ncbi:MAG TPA: hypothetical protein VGM17_02210 [Rhizomicrobium sp.]